MSTQTSVTYLDAKARIVRAINRITTFVQVTTEYEKDYSNKAKLAKARQMLSDLKSIRKCVEDDVQLMETCVSQKLAPAEVVDNQCSLSLSDSFFSLYYDLAAFGEIHELPIVPINEASHSDNLIHNQTIGNASNLSCYQLPKRKFPTFSGEITEWQSFEDLFLSILSHVPELPSVERFEYLKTSLEGEALCIISHLAITASNYVSAWEILRARFGNKRDLARNHLEALLAPHNVRSTDANSIKKLLNSILEHTAALDNLDFITRTWSLLLIHIFEKFLDYELRSRWELIVGDKHAPTITEFVTFLRNHIRSAEIFGNTTTCQSYLSNQQAKSTSRKHQTFSLKSQPKILTTSINQTFDTKCVVCNKPHSIRKCQLFLGKTAHERFQLAKNVKLCINCLGSGHLAAVCPSKYRCQTCNRSHHSLLHFDATPTKINTSTITSEPTESPTTSTTSLIVRGQSQKIVLLSTVCVNILAANGQRHRLRALLDSGSQASFITDKAIHTLMLPRHHSSVNINTFASTSSSRVRGKSTIILSPHTQLTPTFSLDVLIVPIITGPSPSVSIIAGQWAHIKNLNLADPSYNIPGSIDLLLGADILPLLLRSGQRTGNLGEPMAMETVFGWVLMGEVNINTSVTSLCLSVSEPIDVALKKFWELEELPIIHHVSPDDTIAEEIYRKTTTRLSSGRFMVNIPFRTPHPMLGDSKSIALQRFKALEMRLMRNTNLRQQYVEFLNDYLISGHMELIPVSERNNPLNYYIPHHCVLKPESSTTKLRVVFNASSRTTAGMSLNESMYTGPKLQPDIQTVLLRIRLWKYVFTADIKQMYRQILVNPEDRDYQRILWRFTPTSPIEEYRLCMVTYGLSAAPYQALRTIRELATVDGQSWPIAANVLLNDTFVDDILTGANSLPDALECQAQLIKLCSLAHFELRKWASNCKEILEAVATDACVISPTDLLSPSEQTGLKVLGLRWDPLNDSFSFIAHPSGNNPTKRAVLSDIARVFDPLGLLSPITFWTKHLMQRLWTAGIAWDDPVPDDIALHWIRYQSELKSLEKISIIRRLTYDHTRSCQLHAFSDSSEKGYAAAVYLRIETQSSVHCHLVTGKSKVAPLKKCTIPRLELCGAVLAAKLLHLVVNVYTVQLKIDEQHAWTDSTTALAWIRSSPHRWATFIANRCSQIQELTSPSIWRHVPTLQNPVDCASRGLFPSELVNHPLWWTGPSFLLKPCNQWPETMIPQPDSIDPLTRTEARLSTLLTVNTDRSFLELLDRISSYSKILRVVAYCLRFVKRQSSLPLTKIINADETFRAQTTLIYSVQQMVYIDDIVRLTKGLRCSKKLRPLNPFIDDAGMIRVGGRLNNADLPYVHKHPLLLPSRHRLTDLLIDHHHHRLKHPGPLALQAALQREFWIQSVRKAIRSRLRRCVPCFRTRPRSLQPKMSSLPKYRVQQVKPFEISGVDYAGPITLKGTRKQRSTGSTAYICLFVCTTTKAIHLELSSDLSTETFLLAFTRFSARRGPIKELHSDCGTNFVGAAHLLTPPQTLTHSQSFQNSVKNHLAINQTSWHFNPPASPHFGGLWEAGVKSTKSLLLRSIGNHKLTSEEMITLLTQIEATLNARPLCALSNDPVDFQALTPSHFLTLEPSTSLPDPNLESVPLSKLQLWRLITDMHRHFWSRWRNEYLSSLQLRAKWSDQGKDLKVGELALIRDNTHPLHWRLGRIRQLHPGIDGVSRVATLDTPSGSLTRPAVKLCPLPIA